MRTEIKREELATQLNIYQNLQWVIMLMKTLKSPLKYSFEMAHTTVSLSHTIMIHLSGNNFHSHLTTTQISSIWASGQHWRLVLRLACSSWTKLVKKICMPPSLVWNVTAHAHSIFPHPPPFDSTNRHKLFLSSKCIVECSGSQQGKSHSC